MNTSGRFSLRFRLCNLIFGDDLRQAMAFGMLRLEKILRYNEFNTYFDGIWCMDLWERRNELSRIMYGVNHCRLEYDKESRPTNSTTFRFKLCNLLYRGKLGDEIIWAMCVLNSMLDYLKTNHYKYDTFISCGAQCIIGAFERVMY